MVICLIGNKSDLEMNRQVPFDEAQVRIPVVLGRAKKMKSLVFDVAHS
jgi:hypothetical protein